MSRRFKHRCCPFIRQTWIALAFLIVASFFMALLQLYPDSIDDSLALNVTLPDLGFKLIPQLTDDFSAVGDIWVGVTIGAFLLITIFILDTPQLVIRRWLFLMAILYSLRGLTVITTRYPRLPFKGDRYLPSDPIVGALSIIVGIHSTATDMMFSGHTINFILTASFVSRYTNYGVFSYFYWLSNVLGILALIAIREHYTADIVIAIIITKLAFWVYHLFFDTLYKRFWVSGLDLENTGNINLVLPAKIHDSAGQQINIDGYIVSDMMMKTAINMNNNGNGKLIRFISLDPFNGFRYQLYKVLKWLDYE